jgi:arsenate reductase
MRIYHNPNCGTSRTVLGMIRAAGIEPEIVEYLKSPPDRHHLGTLFSKLGLKPRDMLRRKGTTLETLGMDEAKMSDAAILDAIVTHPILLERPIVVEGDEACICRPADRVTRFLNAEDRSPPEG